MTQMGNWLSSPPKRGGGDIFSDVRQIQKDIQRSKSQSDIAISLKLQQSAKSPKSKFLQARFGGSKSREASGDRGGVVQSSASVSSVPQALVAAQERARKRDKSNPGKRKASKSRDTGWVGVLSMLYCKVTISISNNWQKNWLSLSHTGLISGPTHYWASLIFIVPPGTPCRDISSPKEEEKPIKMVQQSNGPDETAQSVPTAKDNSLTNAAKATDEGKGFEEETVVFQPSSKKPSNPFADAPKKLDEVFGDIRKSEPVPEVMPLDVDRNVAVYFETGDYSVSGLGEDVKLKPKQLTARQGINRIQRNSHWNITVYKISVCIFNYNSP